MYDVRTMNKTKGVAPLLIVVFLVCGCAKDESTPLETEVSETILHRYIAAEQAYTDGDTNAALTQIDSLLQSDPSFEPALFLAGKMRVLENDYPTAISHLESVLTSNTFHIDARKWLARAYRISGNTQNAQEVLIPALRISTEDPELLIEMARIFRDQDDIAGAMEYYGKAFALTDRLAVAAYELAELYAIFGVDRRAAQTLDRAYALSSEGSSIREIIEKRQTRNSNGQ